MKCLTVYVNTSVENYVLDCLRGAPEVEGFTLTGCQGHSTSTERDVFQATRDLVVGYVPRLRIDIILQDPAVESVLERLRECAGESGLAGAWFVTEVSGFGRL